MAEAAGPETRLSYWTVANHRRYPLPNGCQALEVVYVGREYPRPLLVFQVPLGRAYWRVYSMDGPPQTEEAAFHLLEAAWSHMHHNFWFQFEDTLLLHPPPPNDGELLIVTVE